MWRRTTGRWRRALAVLAVVERRSPALPSPARWRPLEAAGAAAYGLPPHPGLPKGLVPAAADQPIPLSAPVSTDGVLIGKFDGGRQARMRSFYAEDGLCARVQAGSRRPGQEHGITRSVRAAEVVGRHSPWLVPTMVDHGSVFRGRTAYLVEEVVRGRIPRRPEVRDTMARLVRGLHVVHRAVGIEERRLSQVVAPDFVERWRHLVAAGHIDAPVAAAVDALIRRDALLGVSFGHGDLVSSNILLTGKGPTLIDWEHAGTQPIAFDLAKIHLNAGPQDAATPVLEDALAGSVGRGRDHYTLAEQLALAHVTVLSRFEARLAKARAAGRLAALELQTSKRVQAVQDLLALHP